MKNKILFLLLTLIFLPLLSDFVSAETIVLKSGETIEGELIEKGNDYIKINFHGIPLTYFFGDIDTIDGRDIASIENDETINIGVTDSPEASIVFWKSVAAKDPKDTTAYNNIGLAYTELGEYRKGIEYFQKAIEIDPELAASYSYIGLTYVSLNDYPSAIYFLEKAVELEPTNPNMASVYNSLGVNQLRSERYNEAIPFLEKAIEINPNYADAYSNLGGAYAKLQQFDKAIRNLESAIEINANRPDAYLNLASVYEFLGQKDKAKEAYSKAKEIFQRQRNYNMVEKIEKILQEY